MTTVNIIVFAKAPVAGLAKTRLIPQLGAEKAARLAAYMLQHTLTEACAADIGNVELCVTPAIQAECWSNVTIPSDVAVSDQGGGDLGERLARAAVRTLATSQRVLLIGTDCPALTRERLRAAGDSLSRCDAVIHPAVDGGYTLLGLRRVDSTLFDAIAWSTNTVATTTMARIRQLGWTLHVGETLHDIDEPADLDQVPVEWDTRVADMIG